MIRRAFLGCTAAGLAGYALWPDGGEFDFGWLSGDAASSPLGRLAGTRIRVAGYGLPHLAARGDFFLLSGRPSTVCPHCQPSPSGLETLAVFPRAGTKIANGIWEGTLDVGAKVDPVSGYLSLARLFDAEFRRA
jgi:hypothetical protein